MIAGYFSYKPNDNFTRLDGIYFNNDTNNVRTTVANRIRNDLNLIEGVYNENWFETTEIELQLEITRSGELYTLTWFNDQNTIFYGTGVFNKGRLSGYYSDKTNQEIRGIK